MRIINETLCKLKGHKYNFFDIYTDINRTVLLYSLGKDYREFLNKTYNCMRCGKERPK